MLRCERAAPSTRFGAARTGHNNDKGRGPMMDSNRRTILTTGAAVAATATVPQVFAQQGGQGGATSFYEKGNVRIRYQEIGSGFPLLVTPGGGLNSRISNCPNAVFNPIDVLKNHFLCFPMEQRKASAGDATDPTRANDPW